MLLAAVLVVGLWSSSAHAAASRVVSSGAGEGPVVLVPDDDGPYELVRDEDEDEDWDEDAEEWGEGDEAEEGLEAADGAGEDGGDGQVAIGEGRVRSARLVQGGGRTARPQAVGPGGKALAVSSSSPGPEAVPNGPTSGPTDGPAAAVAMAGGTTGVLGTQLEPEAVVAVPPTELFAAPAAHSTGPAPVPASDYGSAALVLLAALLAGGALGAGVGMRDRRRP